MMATGHYAKGTKAQASAKANRAAKRAAREAAYAAEKAAAQDQINELRGTGPGRSSLVDIANERQGLIDRITGNVSSFVGIGNYDVSARSDALAEAAAAQSEVNNSAVGSSARQSAMARLRAAQDKVASAPASVGAWLRQRVDKVRRWKDVLGRLGGVWGSTPAGQQLLQEIFDKGPDGGTELGEELLRNPGELQELMQLQGEAGMLGYQAAMGNPAVIDATNRYTRQAQVVEQLQTVVLQLNGKVLHEALLQIKRSAGGQALGLA
jgi:predicted flap endonuclease-1-like 5' DNA nuclease